MRVIAGTFKGHRLRAEDGLTVRPTSDRLRETLFNILMPVIEGADFLDLCAGSGAVGIEAVSRGAGHVTFVEQSRKTLRNLVENLNHCKIEDGFTLAQRDAESAVKQFVAEERAFDVVFFDPPYASDVYGPVMELFGEHPLLKEDGMLIVEHHSKAPMPETVGNLRRFREVKQGESCLSFYECA
jgi:16S rRNA (guanine966-N2)-methyltransferase